MLPVTTIYFDSSTAFLVTNNFMFAAAALLLVIAIVTKWHSHSQFVFSHLQVCETTFAKIIFADKEIKEHQHKTHSNTVESKNTLYLSNRKS